MPIKINCYTTSGILRSIHVEDFITMESINNYIGKVYTLIYHGNVVIKGLTVGSYQMKDGDCLIAVNPKNSKEISKWKNISLENSSIMKRFNSKYAVEIERERIRLRDIMWQRIDYKPKRFMKEINKVSNPNNDKKDSQYKYKTQLSKENKISTDPLPSFWNK